MEWKWADQILVLKYGCILIMEQCQLLRNLGHVAVSLKKHVRGKLTGNI